MIDDESPASRPNTLRYDMTLAPKTTTQISSTQVYKLKLELRKNFDN